MQSSAENVLITLASFSLAPQFSRYYVRAMLLQAKQFLQKPLVTLLNGHFHADIVSSFTLGISAAEY